MKGLLDGFSEEDLVGKQTATALQNFRSAMEGIGHIRRTLEETFGGLHGTHCEPDVLVECKAICDAICDAYQKSDQVLPERSREHFISLCNEFWNWSVMDLACADDRGYELRMEWDGKVFTHPVTQALWRMYQAAPGNSPVIPDGWIPVSERMPEKNQNVLISVNFDSDLVEPLICSARYTGSTFRRGDATVKPGTGIEEATHWMPLPAAPEARA